MIPCLSLQNIRVLAKQTKSRMKVSKVLSHVGAIQGFLKATFFKRKEWREYVAGVEKLVSRFIWCVVRIMSVWACVCLGQGCSSCAIIL
jgi:hypothetical protein